jgi:hypothetical protein
MFLSVILTIFLYSYVTPTPIIVCNNDDTRCRDYRNASQQDQCSYRKSVVKKLVFSNNHLSSVGTSHVDIDITRIPQFLTLEVDDITLVNETSNYSFNTTVKKISKNSSLLCKISCLGRIQFNDDGLVDLLFINESLLHCNVRSDIDDNTFYGILLLGVIVCILFRVGW